MLLPADRQRLPLWWFFESIQPEIWTPGALADVDNTMHATRDAVCVRNVRQMLFAASRHQTGVIVIVEGTLIIPAAASFVCVAPA